MRLRTALIASAAALVVLAVGTAATLLAIGRFGRDGASYIVLSVRSVELAQQIRLDVERLRAEGADARDAKAAIESNLALARKLVQSDAELQIIERLQRAIDGLRSALAQPDRDELLADAAQEADSAAAALVAINVQQAHDAEANVARQSVRGVLWAEGVAAALVVGIICVIAWTRARVLEPLAVLRRRIHAVALGDDDPKTAAAAPVEVREVAETFDAMSAAIAARRQDRLELLGRVASGMSAPLDRIMAVCDGLTPAGPLPPDRQLRSAFGTLGRELVRLRRVLDEYIEAAHVEEGEFEVRDEIVDLAEIVSEGVEMFRDLAPANRFEFVSAGPAAVHGDARRLAQVVNNLLAIAVRQASAVGRVRIQLRAEQGEQRLDIDVTSPGEANFERLYNALHGLDLAMLGVPGTGFTIQTSRRLIDAMRGRLIVERHGTDGVSVSVRLRAAAALSAAASG